MRQHTAGRRLAALILGAVLVVSACGSDVLDEAEAPDDTAASAATTAAPAPADNDTADDDTADGMADEEPAATTEAMADDDTAGDDMADEPSGEPIVIGAVLGSAGEGTYQSSINGLLAAEKAINAAGGIDGRPIQIEHCRDEVDPNIAVQCMQDIIDAGAVTFVGNFNCCGAQVIPELVAQGFSVIEGFMLTGGDMAVPGFYSSNGGAFVAGAGQAPLCAALGATRIAAAYVDVEAGAQLPPLIQGVLPLAWPDVQLVASEPMPLGTTDYAPIAAKLIAADPDCVLGLSGRDQVNPLIKALRQQGYTDLIAASGAATSVADLLVDVGPADAEGVALPLTYNRDSAGWAQFVAELAAHNPDRVGDDISVSAWLGVYIAADVISQVGTDPAAISAAIPEIVVNYDTQGLTKAPLDWSVPGENPLGIPLVNVRNWDFVPSQIINGEEVISGEGWVNFFTGRN